MSLSKRAFARGINDELIRHGVVRFPTKEAADAVADAVGDEMPAEPAAAPVPPETAAAVATTLVDAANELVSATGADASAPPLPEEEAMKMSAAQDVDTRANAQATAIMYKAAAEKQAMGSTIEGGDKGNTLAEAGSQSGEAKIENDRRPDMYANVGVRGVGDTSTGIGRGTGVVGDETVPAPDSPGESPAGTNTVIDQSKMGSLQDIIRKVAMAGMGSTISGGDKGNTLPEAASQTGEAQLENDRRPMGYAHMGVLGVGKTETPIGRDPASSIGHEMPHPDQPGESPAGAVPGAAGNTVVEQSNASKNAAFLSLFKKTAEEVGTFVPANLTEEEKIGHIRQMMGMTDAERDAYIGMLHKSAGATDDQAVAAAEKHAAAACARRQRRYTGNPNRQDRTRANQKTAMSDSQESGLPEALKNAIKAKGGNGEDEEQEEPGESAAEEKKEEKMEEKQEEMSSKESSALLSRIRSISQQHAGA